jgi:hypothetical protein
VYVMLVQRQLVLLNHTHTLRSSQIALRSASRRSRDACRQSIQGYLVPGCLHHPPYYWCHGCKRWHQPTYK